MIGSRLNVLFDVFNVTNVEYFQHLKCYIDASIAKSFCWEKAISQKTLINNGVIQSENVCPFFTEWCGPYNR